MPFCRRNRRRVLSALVLALVGALAACQPVPQPFQSEDPVEENPLAWPKWQAGVLVRGVPGAADPDAFAARVAEALQRQNVNATTLGANRASYVLTAETHESPAGSGSVALRIDWRLRDARGRTVARQTQETVVAAEAWQRGDDALGARVAEDAARALAPLMADSRAPVVAQAVLAVHGVDGAPGDGNVSLRRALAYTLAKRGFRVVEGLDGANVVIAGAVRVTPAGPATEEVSIVWSALRPDGTSLGTVEQSNRVPKGSLGSAWGVTAIHVAEAATPGLARLIAAAAPRLQGGDGR